MRIEAQYLYTDERGRPIALKVRTTDKRFYLKAARWYTVDDDQARMIWKTGKGCMERYQPDWADRLLFDLPVVLDALRVGEPVFLVEGERDARTINTLKRVAATTSHLGAKKFTPEQAEWFSSYGKSKSPIHIVRDADDAGAWCAWERYTRLVVAGVEPRRIRLWRPCRPASDVTDALCRWGDTRSALRSESPRAVQRLHMAEGARLAARTYLREGA